jgi:hypothetical protein
VVEFVEAVDPLRRRLGCGLDATMAAAKPEPVEPPASDRATVIGRSERGEDHVRQAEDARHVMRAGLLAPTSTYVNPKITWVEPATYSYSFSPQWLASKPHLLQQVAPCAGRRRARRIARLIEPSIDEPFAG